MTLIMEATTDLEFFVLVLDLADNLGTMLT